MMDYGYCLTISVPSWPSCSFESYASSQCLSFKLLEPNHQWRLGILSFLKKMLTNADECWVSSLQMVSTCLNKQRLLQPDSHLCMALNYTESLLCTSNLLPLIYSLRSLEPDFRRTAKGSYGPWKKKASQHPVCCKHQTFSLGGAPFSASPQERCKLSKSETPVRKCSKMSESTRGLHSRRLEDWDPTISKKPSSAVPLPAAHWSRLSCIDSPKQWTQQTSTNINKPCGGSLDDSGCFVDDSGCLDDPVDCSVLFSSVLRSRPLIQLRDYP